MRHRFRIYDSESTFALDLRVKSLVFDPNHLGIGEAQELLNGSVLKAVRPSCQDRPNLTRRNDFDPRIVLYLRAKGPCCPSGFSSRERCKAPRLCLEVDLRLSTVQVENPHPESPTQGES